MARLNGELAGAARLVSVRWETEFYRAHDTFQTQIPLSTDCNIVVAIFRARPSPFYVLDEVEAALDDANLGRLIAIMEELRESSQLIVITHQKRTMEVADALYGVSMRGDGVTTVISQRLREDQPV